MTQESSLPGEYDQVIFQRWASYRARSKGRTIVPPPPAEIVIGAPTRYSLMFHIFSCPRKSLRRRWLADTEGEDKHSHHGEVSLTLT